MKPSPDAPSESGNPQGPLADLCAVRVLLETHVAVEAANYASDHDLLIDLRRLACSSHADAGRRFHLTLAASTGNQVAVELLSGVLEQIATLAGERAICGEATSACEDHSEIFAAVLAGRHLHAATAIRRHVAAAQRQAVNGLDRGRGRLRLLSS